jgi:hypothetical protein
MDTAWKKRERKAAAAFGVKRTIGSGSLGREDRTCSDSTHDRLFIETKLRKVHTVVALWDKTAKLAKKEKKIPVVMLAQHNRPGLWVMCKLDDLPIVTAEYAAARAAQLKELPGQQSFIGGEDEIDHDKADD